MTTPLVSVIVPVYNVKDFLSQCLDSLLAQTHSNLQIILIDDGSTDGSSELCDTYAKKDPRIIVKHQKNAGLSAARNAGLALAKGDYIFFLDSDDFLTEDCIKYLLTLATSTHSPISICPHLEYHNAHHCKNFAPATASATLSCERAIHDMLLEHNFNLQIAPKLYARTLFFSSPKIRFPVGKLHEDVGTTYRLFLRAYQLDPSTIIAFGAEAKYYYRIRPFSITNHSFTYRKLDLISQTDIMCDRLDATFPSLQNVTNLRRLHARFSILRQIIQLTHKTDKDKKLELSLISYIKGHKSWISQNPEASKRDRLALASLRLGKTFFKFSWRFYELFFK